MDNGWIKLHRKLVEKGYYKRSTYVHLWIHLLLLANHEKKELMWNNQIIVINEGQMITGRKKLSEDTGIAESTIEDILKFLETQHQIQQQKTTKYRLITILNWKSHQLSDRKSNNRATTEQQQADTNKNEKNEKNVRSNTGTSETSSPTPKKVFIKPTLEEVRTYCLERNNQVHPEKWLSHYESNGWKVGRNPMKDWKAAVRTWEHGQGFINRNSPGSTKIEE